MGEGTEEAAEYGRKRKLFGQGGTAVYSRGERIFKKTPKGAHPGL